MHTPPRNPRRYWVEAVLTYFLRGEYMQVQRKQKCVGENHPRAKLTGHEVALILELHDEGRGLGSKSLAKKFEVSRRTIRAILSGKTWGAFTLRD